MKNFVFTDENILKVQKLIKEYPVGKEQSAILSVLRLAQEQSEGWLTKDIIKYVASFLNLAEIEVYEVASFYSMFNLKPIGKNLIEVCSTTPCWLAGSQEIMNAFENFLNVKCGETTADGNFTLRETECLGACIKAPIIQINHKNYLDNVNKEDVISIIQKLKGH